jgi:hypothetical protein
MIKVTVQTKDGIKIDDLRAELTAWCIEHIGPAIPRGQHNQKKRKQWDIKVDNWYHPSVKVFVRKPEYHTMIALKWL